MLELEHFWQSLEDKYELSYKKVKIPEKLNIPHKLIKSQSLFPIRFYNKQIFENLCRNSGWYLYRSRKLNIIPENKKIALTFDCDYKEDSIASQKILPLLKKYGIKASFACVGKLIEHDKEIYNNLYSEGHELVNHTYTHPRNPVLAPDRRFDEISEDEQREEIVKCHNIIKDLTGERPISFRSPHFYDNMKEFKILDEMGYRYCSSVTTNNCMLGLPYHPAREGFGKYSYLMSSINQKDNFNILMIPVDVCPAHKGSVFSTYHCLRDTIGKHHDLNEFCRLWIRVLKENEYKKFICVYFDPMDIAKDDATLKYFEKMIIYAKENEWEFELLKQIEEAK
ncbi:Peptidoglycan/xylan/chitin deacetylase, PgdA/CDA1 family [Candidatus Methanophagaceae archaeon]|nr:Peptidoglycan/xylan/chitin deacetylase, PgdA/CDA1 family [Methanophagales archaeon]